MTDAAWLATPQPGCIAWCLDCSWTNASEWAHKHANAHTAIMGHLTHCVTGASACADVDISDDVHECVMPKGHPGPHRERNHRWG